MRSKTETFSEADEKSTATEAEVALIVTFHVSRRRREMYTGHARLSVCVSVPRRIPTLLHGPGCNLGKGMGCCLVAHYWTDSQSVHGFRCFDNRAQTRNVSECLYSLYAWLQAVGRTLEVFYDYRYPTA